VSDEYGLGALPSPEDERDYQLAEVYAALGIEPAAAFPAAYTVPDRPPILNQGNTPMCVAYSSAALKAWQDHDGPAWIDFDEPRFFVRIGGTPNGAYVRDAMRELASVGYPEQGGGNAGVHKVKAYYAVPATPDGLRAAISALGPVVIATPWYRSWFRPVAGILPAPDVRIGGHAILAVGWTQHGPLLRNSWGSAWGDHGECVMPWRYVAGLWEAWKAIDVPPPPIAWRIHLAHGAQIRRYVLDAAGRITGWTDELWQFAASSAPCEEPVKRRTANGRSTALTVRVIRGKYAAQILAASRPGVTVKKT